MNKEEKIFKELKRRFNMLTEQGYEVAFISLNGSQNYNMDIYTDEYQSDIDCFAIVLPSLQDYMDNKPAVSTTVILENNEHIQIKDIRLYTQLLRKQNVRMLELIFTPYRIINKKYKDIVKELFNNAELIAQINKKSLYMSVYGMASEKYHALQSDKYKKEQNLVNKYGYDGKQLHHLIRLSQFIYNLEDNMTFRESLIYCGDLVKDVCIKAKLQKLDSSEALMYADNSMKVIKALTVDNVENSVDNEEYIQILDNVRKQLLLRYFKEQLYPDKEEPYDLDKELKNYNNVYVISDTHFGHINILEFEERNKYMSVVTVEDMDNKLISNWNNIVTNKDLVLVLGDFSFYKGPKTNEILKQLNGDKVLIKGNHDNIYLEDKKFDKSLYKAIYDYKEINYNCNNIVLMHYPIQHFKHSDKEKGWVHLFGHIHSVPFMTPRHSFNVGADVNNYTPVLINNAIQTALNNNGKVNLRH